jgi:hypothetical protein
MVRYNSECEVYPLTYYVELGVDSDRSSMLKCRTNWRIQGRAVTPRYIQVQAGDGNKEELNVTNVHINILRCRDATVTILWSYVRASIFVTGAQGMLA